MNSLFDICGGLKKGRSFCVPLWDDLAAVGDQDQGGVGGVHRGAHAIGLPELQDPPPRVEPHLPVLVVGSAGHLVELLVDGDGGEALAGQGEGLAGCCWLKLHVGPGVVLEVLQDILVVSNWGAVAAVLIRRRHGW